MKSVWKKYFAGLLVLNCTLALAGIESCPSLTEIQTNQLQGWLPLYIDGEEMASDEDARSFENAVRSFKVARWNPDYLESGHCFYEGDSPVMEKIVLAKDAWHPEGSGWTWLLPNKSAECHADAAEHCQFTE